jgi:hypothetical protein
MNVAITGLGVATVNFTEYYNLNVVQAYTNLIIPLKNIFDEPSSSVAPSDYDTILTQVQGLQQLASQGIIENNGAGETFPSYINEQMATDLNSIMQTLAVVGIPPNPNAPPLSDQQKVAALQTWQSLPNFQINVLGALNNALEIIATSQQYTVQIAAPGTGILTNLEVNASPGSTLQSMLNIEYIGSANSEMSAKLGLLQSAVSLSQQVLTTLAGIESISNQIRVSNPSPLFQLPSSNLDITTYTSVYQKDASAYFAQIYPSAVPVASAAQSLLTLQQQLYGELLLLEKANPTAGRNVTGTLANAAYTVIQNISSVFSGISMQNNPELQNQLFGAVKTWILDNQNQALTNPSAQNSAGAIQNNIQNAINTGENLEETQRENVTSYLFVFQQFYKSASAILLLINQVFSKIEQGIS